MCYKNYSNGIFFCKFTKTSYGLSEVGWSSETKGSSISNAFGLLIRALAKETFLSYSRNGFGIKIQKSLSPKLSNKKSTLSELKF